MKSLKRFLGKRCVVGVHKVYIGTLEEVDGDDVFLGDAYEVESSLLDLCIESGQSLAKFVKRDIGIIYQGDLFITGVKTIRLLFARGNKSKKKG